MSCFSLILLCIAAYVVHLVGEIRRDYRSYVEHEKSGKPGPYIRKV